MNVVMLNVFSLLVMIHVVLQHVSSQKCSSSGFDGCECNILGACDIRGNPKHGLDSKLTGYAPKNVEQFRYKKPAVNNLAYLCERETVTIMYDCNAKIPLYAATMMTATQLNYPKLKRQGSFRLSGDSQLQKIFQQATSDYKDSSRRVLCYETSSKYLVDMKWYESKHKVGLKAPQKCALAQKRLDLKSPMAKGHLIAANYGRGNDARIKATFTYTNAVPQFGTFNSGQWAQSERQLITWGKNNCANEQDARMFIVVGAIPSTYSTYFSKRFFGAPGFSDFKGKSYRSSKEYRVNVPRYMWTAACCTFKKNKLGLDTKSFAFFRTNDLSSEPCWTGTPNQMVAKFRHKWSNMKVVTLFPQNKGC